MDILRKMFQVKDKEGSAAKDKDNATATGKDEFRKPQWFEESETDDELFDDDRKFAFQIFTNPMELQKHFERQMQQIMEAVSEFDESEVKVEKNLKEEFLKPGFESEIRKEFEKQKKKFVDTDLDGEIYADQLHSLMQRLNDEELPRMLPRNDNKTPPSLFAKKPLTDEETILGRIHGTIVDDELAARARTQRAHPDIMTPMKPLMPRGSDRFGGVFEGSYQGPKMFSQSVMTKTVRKPDGSFETTKITQDSDGRKSTTVTRTIDGKSETVTTYDGHGAGSDGGGGSTQKSKDSGGVCDPERRVYSDRNICVTKEGYAVPRNLW